MSSVFTKSIYLYLHCIVIRPLSIPRRIRVESSSLFFYEAFRSNRARLYFKLFLCLRKQHRIGVEAAIAIRPVPYLTLCGYAQKNRISPLIYPRSQREKKGSLPFNFDHSTNPRNPYCVLFVSRASSHPSKISIYSPMRYLRRGRQWIRG